MQNRNMYLYRRQGPKKRTKPGPSRKNRGPQKGLPNSARDLLPLIQPATKALAQMLAGRTAASGQLGHARAVLAQTERLVSDRAHNRLNPAEREEFFEQVARLKLTLADAESEAEVQAMEDDAPAALQMPVNRERLKEMAMALTSPGGATSYENRHQGRSIQDEQPETSENEDETAADPEPAAAPARPEDPNQLRLPRASADRVAIQPSAIRSRANGRRRAVAKTASPAATLSDAAPKAEAPKLDAKIDDVPADSSDGVETTTAVRARAEKQQKLPDGWIIDDEGFVVPGPA